MTESKNETTNNYRVSPQRRLVNGFLSAATLIGGAIATEACAPKIVETATAEPAPILASYDQESVNNLPNGEAKVNAINNLKVATEYAQEMYGQDYTVGNPEIISLVEGDRNINYLFANITDKNSLTKRKLMGYIDNSDPKLNVIDKEFIIGNGEDLGGEKGDKLGGYYDEDGKFVTIVKENLDGTYVLDPVTKQLVEKKGFVGELMSFNTTPVSAEALPTPTEEVFSTSTDFVTVTPETTMTAELPTEVITPDEMIYTAQALEFVPHSVEEIANSVEIRSPIDDPQGYKEDMNKVLEVINGQILPDYTGDFVESGKNMMAIDPERGCIFFDKGVTLNPIASVNFEWNGYNVPILFFPTKDSQGSFAFGMVLSPTMSDTDRNNNNPAPDWSISEMIKNFPMTIKSGMLEVRYSNAGVYSTVLTAKDPFYSAYFSNRESDDYNAAVWNFFIRNEDFDRQYEYLPFVVLGGE